MSSLRVLSRTAARAALAVALLAVPSAALAAPYEQVNRATGAQGSAPWGYTYAGTAVGDIGRYAGWERLRWGYQPGELPDGFVRDIQTNTTLDYGGGVRRVYAFDRAEQRALILRTRNGLRQVVVVPIAGGAPIIVAEFPAGGTLPEATISGDGRKVVVTAEGNYGTRSFDITGGVVSQPTWLSFKFSGRFASRGISTDGSVVVAASSLGTGLSVYRVDSGEVELPDTAAAAAVDATGTTVAYVDRVSPVTLVTRSLQTGIERRVPATGTIGFTSGVLWVGQGGSSVIVAPESFETANATMLYTAGSGLDGTWSKFGGRFSSGIWAADGGTPISANARFAVTRTTLPGSGTAVSLFDTSGAHIVGANEGFSAAAFIRGGTVPIGTCTSARFNAYLFQPAPFAPLPTKAVITARFGGQVIATGTLTKAQAFGYLGTIPNDERVSGLYPISSPGDVELTATVTDGDGRVVSETWTEPYGKPYPNCS